MKMSDFPPTIDFVWTAIWDSILLWLDNLQKYSNNEEKPWIILLITDWDSNKWVDPLQAAQYSYNKNIPIFTLWLWFNDYIVWYDKTNTPVTTQINVDLLKNISSVSWWKFYRVLDETEFKLIFDEIETFIKSYEKDIKIVEYTYIEKYVYFLILICLLYFLTKNILLIYNNLDLYTKK
jgi:hypothetical protein